MIHFYNRTVLNENFDWNTIDTVWQKGQIITGYDPNLYRKDSCGAWMKRSDYGNVKSDLGWEIDHVKPVAKGGSDLSSNLQPLHWKNNRGKSDNWPQWTCSYKAG